MSRSDVTALETVYSAYADLLYRLALSHLQHREDALDAVQDVFVRLASSGKSFRDGEHERAWLIRVTINRCHDLARRRAVRAYTPLGELEHLKTNDDTLRPAVLSAVDTLSDKHKSVVVLHYLEGFSVEETAAILKLSVSAVKMRLARARESLKSTLEREDLYV